VKSGALSKRIQPGFAASGGVLSALMASKGITGAKESMEGKYGMFNLYQRGDYDRDVITANLGKTFEVTNISFKPYPCCRFLGGPIDTALKLQEEYNILPEQIDEVIVEVNQRAYDEYCIPTEVKHKPRTITDAQFSIPFGVATALVRRRAIIEDFMEEAIRDKDVLLLLTKVRSKASAEISKDTIKVLPKTPCRLTVKARGHVYSTTLDILKGSLENPMSDREIEFKFKDCGNHAVKPLSANSIATVLDKVRKLEEVGDVGQILKCIS
jgi:2-methylcitrate dehydratase PrpD